MNNAVKHPLQVRTEKLLRAYGGLYLFEDILAAIERSDMQSFALNESWAVTQICEFPRKRVLDIVLMVGKLDDLILMETDLIGFAREQDLDMITANGINKLASAHKRGLFAGWKQVTSTFIKDLRDGA